MNKPKNPLRNCQMIELKNRATLRSVHLIQTIDHKRPLTIAELPVTAK